jgi:hypothetical protein
MFGVGDFWLKIRVIISTSNYKNFQNGRLKKTLFFKISKSQYFFPKFLEIGPWVSRIDGCEGH